LPIEAPVELPPEIAAHLNDKRREGRQPLSRGAVSRRQAIGEFGRKQIKKIVADNRERAAKLVLQANALPPGHDRNKLLRQVADIRAERLSRPNRNKNTESIKEQAAEKARVFANERYGENFSKEFIIRYCMDKKIRTE
jgi:hypothetical protein